MKPAAVRPSPLPPKTLVLRDVAGYLGLGSPQAAERWLKAHQVRVFQDRLGYNRAYVKEIDAANLRSYAEADQKPLGEQALDVSTRRFGTQHP